jgi:hypothetical protein
MIDPVSFHRLDQWIIRGCHDNTTLLRVVYRPGFYIPVLWGKAQLFTLWLFLYQSSLGLPVKSIQDLADYGLQFSSSKLSFLDKFKSQLLSFAFQSVQNLLLLQDIILVT